VRHHHAAELFASLVEETDAILGSR
jgi:hypothetical protein